MTITTEQLRNAYQQSGNVYSGSEKIGRIGQIYLDDETSEPTWVTVRTGLFGTAESFVPLYEARIEGNDIMVDYDEETIKNAPRIEADDDLTPREELELFRYYGRSATATLLIGTTRSIGRGTSLIGAMTRGIGVTLRIRTLAEQRSRRSAKSVLSTHPVAADCVATSVCEGADRVRLS